MGHPMFHWEGRKADRRAPRNCQLQRWAGLCNKLDEIRRHLWEFEINDKLLTKVRNEIICQQCDAQGWRPQGDMERVGLTIQVNFDPHVFIHLFNCISIALHYICEAPLGQVWSLFSAVGNIVVLSQVQCTDKQHLCHLEECERWDLGVSVYIQSEKHWYRIQGSFQSLIIIIIIILTSQSCLNIK